MAEERAVIEVAGMSCEHCVETVQKGLAAAPGVLGVEVRLEPGEAAVHFDSARTSVAKLLQAVKATGFEARGFRRTKV